MPLRRALPAGPDPRHSHPPCALPSALHQAFLGFLSLVAIGGFLVEAPNLRLLICGVGVAISLTQTIGTWFQGSVRRNRAVGTYARDPPASCPAQGPLIPSVP